MFEGWDINWRGVRFRGACPLATHIRGGAFEVMGIMSSSRLDCEVYLSGGMNVFNMA